jgi:hypothetical protein
MRNISFPKKFNRVHYHTMVFLVYGVVQILIPYAFNFYVLLVQMAILGLMDGVYLCFIVPISFDVSESPVLANHAIGKKINLKVLHLVCRYYGMAKTKTLKISALPLVETSLQELLTFFNKKDTIM